MRENGVIYAKFPVFLSCESHAEGLASTVLTTGCGKGCPDDE
jgi:hypothetical protein